MRHLIHTLQFLQLLLFVCAEPIDWSKIPVKKAHITRIHFKCENCEKAGRVMNSASLLREVTCKLR